MSHPFFRSVRTGAIALFLAVPVAAQQVEKIDAAGLAKIRDEGMQRSKVMEITSYLTDVYGARLTGSPQTKAAGEWVVSQLKSWGLSNPRLEPWGPFGRGWSNEKFTARVVSPSSYSLIAYPGAWSTGTSGPVTAEVVMVPDEANPRCVDDHVGDVVLPPALGLRGEILKASDPLRDFPDVEAHVVRLLGEALQILDGGPEPLDLVLTLPDQVLTPKLLGAERALVACHDHLTFRSCDHGMKSS